MWFPAAKQLLCEGFLLQGAPSKVCALPGRTIETISPRCKGADMVQANDPVARLNQLIRGINVAMLTTVRPDGSLHSCPMAPHEVDPAGALWLISDNQTEKVEAIKTSPRVNLSFTDHAGQRYVSISGFCEVCGTTPKQNSYGVPATSPGSPAGSTIPTSSC